MNLYRIKATVLISFSGDLKALCEKLAADLQVQAFDYDVDPEPPHEMFAWNEYLGFEPWIYDHVGRKDYNYKFILESTNTPLSIKNIDKCGDMSEWFAEYLRIVSGLDIISFK